MDLISIVVPIYNCEKYLKKMLDSLLCQSYKNIEIILVDDGSKDGSGKICDDYALKDQRIKVIHRENGGTAIAKNVGIKEAKGKYLMIVDADDYVEEKIVENYYNAMIKYDVDLVCGNTENTKNRQIKEDIIIKGDDCGKRYVVDYYKLAPYNPPWAKLYKTQTVNKLFDDRQLKGADVGFNLDYLKNVKSICIIPDYSYVFNAGDIVSNTRRYKLNEFQMFCRSNRKLFDFLGDLNEYSNHDIRCRLFNAAKSSCMLCLKSNLSLKEKYHEVTSIVKNDELHDSLKLVDNLSLINRIVYFMFKYKLSLISFMFFYITILIKK